MPQSGIRRYIAAGTIVGVTISALPLLIALILMLITESLGLRVACLKSLEQSMWAISSIIAIPIIWLFTWICSLITPDQTELVALRLLAAAPFISILVGSLAGLMIGRIWYHFSD